MTGEQRRRHFCTRVKVAVLTPPYDFMVCGEWQSEKLSYRGLQQESLRGVKFQ